MARTYKFSAVPLALIIGAAAWVFFNPIGVRDTKFRLDVWRSGAKTVRHNGLTGFQRNTCRPGGACKCVALIHGLGDTALTWRHMLKDGKSGRIPAGFHVFALNMPGTRDSAQPSSPQGFSLTEQAHTLADTLRGLCAQPQWTVVGNSLGGWIAARMALERPEVIDRLVLVNAAGLRDPSGTIEQAGRTLAYPTAESIREFASRAHHRPKRAPRRVWSKMAARIRKSNNVAILKTVTDDDYLDDELSALQVPTDVVWGRSDRVIPLEMGKRFAAGVRGATYRSIQACGHLPQSECPTVLK